MTYKEWKDLRNIRSEDAKRVVRDFELNNPGLAALYEKQKQEEIEAMRQAMTIPDRMERWKVIAKLEDNTEWKARRQREVM